MVNVKSGISLGTYFNGFQEIIKKKISRYAWTTLLAAQFAAMKRADYDTFAIKPDLIIAGIPVWHVNRLGHASSDEILKYRSMGGVFLAHQKGGKRTFKFTARMFGAARYAMVKILEILLELGTEQARSFSGLGFGGFITFAEGEKNVVNVDSLKVSKDDPLIEWSKLGKFENQEYAYHRTYPIITDTRIYTDMYMETMIIREDVRLGKDCVEVQCAFRQYIAPTEFQKTAEEGEGPAFNPNATKKYYKTYIPRDQLTWLNRLDFVINFSWALLQYMGDMADHKEWYKKEEGKMTFEVGNLIKTYAIHQVYQTAKYWRPNA